MNTVDMRETVQGAGFEWKGNFTNPGDYVGEGLGGNEGVNGQASGWQILNIPNAFDLFKEEGSPHSSYICANQDKLICGE